MQGNNPTAMKRRWSRTGATAPPIPRAAVENVRDRPTIHRRAYLSTLHWMLRDTGVRRVAVRSWGRVYRPLLGMDGFFEWWIF